jgi:hypothetical protein
VRLFDRPLLYIKHPENRAHVSPPAKVAIM